MSPEIHCAKCGHPLGYRCEGCEAYAREVETYRTRWLSCVTPEEATRLREEAAKLKAALKEIGQWSVEILNADRGAVHHELREFAGDCYGQVTDALGGQP